MALRIIFPIFYIFCTFLVSGFDRVLADDDFCFYSVSEKFGLDRILLESISYVESSHNSSALNVNSSSIDFGHMQINSYWISVLGEDYLYLDEPCYCTKIGAEILSDCINSYGYNRDALSCYNSGKPLDKLNNPTRGKVLQYIAKIESRYDKLLGECDE